ncbi:uncharacterized protein LOC144104704 [Amblyomma americanum]
MTATADTTGSLEAGAAGVNNSEIGFPKMCLYHIKKRTVLWGIIVFLLAVGVTGVTVGVISTQKTPPVKVYLDEYRKISFYKVSRPQPYRTITDIDQEQCAKNCTSDDQFSCLHLEFCERQGEALGTCHLFPDDAKLRPTFSENCYIYTKGDAEDFHIPHGGSSSLKKGLFEVLISSSFTAMVVFKLLTS